MKHGQTAVYTILKNELKYIDKWLYYADSFDYRVLLDTGSTDGSWEYLQQCAAKDPNLIIEQKIFKPWRFDTARIYNLAMVPKSVVWCLSPDLDEYFSINTHNEMEKIISNVPDITNIACDRLDLYSPVVRVGPPNNLSSNKIHRREDYTWVQPIYEHLRWIHTDRDEKELYSPDIFLVHDQDFNKKERSQLYLRMLEDEYRLNPHNTWTLWFLLTQYKNEQNIEKFVAAACDYIRFHDDPTTGQFITILDNLRHLYANGLICDQDKTKVWKLIKNYSI